jgi:membrane-associated protein
MNLLQLITTIAEQNKYSLLFIVYLLEGPVSAFISAMLASIGELNILIIFPLLIVAEISADIFYYYIGKSISTSKLQKKLSKYEKKGSLQPVKSLLEEHPVKVLIINKTISFLAVPVILLIGKYQTLKVKEFILWASLISIVKDIIILSLGYGFGISLETFLRGYNIYVVIGIILSILFLIYIFFKLYRDKIEKVTLKLLKKI